MRIMIRREILNALEAMFGGRAFQIEELCGGGSARKFYRAASSAVSFVASISEDLEEFEFYCEFGRFFEKSKVPVPHFYEEFHEFGAAIMEDAGDMSLYKAALQNDRGHNLNLYKKVLDELAHFQTIDASNCKKLFERIFDESSFLWESSYFASFFLKEYAGVKAIPSAVSAEFELLASLLADLPKFPMHRDFQSQNIFIRNGRVIFIDFQGARMGNPFYDAASLIQDPYVCLDFELTEDLISYFYALRSADLSIDERDAKRYFLLTSVSRLMQALGAYSNLSRNKGKPLFSRYIAPALMRLNFVLSQVEDLPALRNFMLNVADSVL